MVKIKELTIQNPWWKHGKRFTNFDRDIKKIRSKPIFFNRTKINLEKGNIYVLRGPRQVGKTTYMKVLVKDLLSRGVPAGTIMYLSTDFFISRRELRNAITYFINKNIDSSHLYILIDEITSIKDWNLELKYLSDSGIAENAVILATGSNASALRKEGELLPGRDIEGNEYFVRPLSFREFVMQTMEIIRDRIKDSGTREALGELKSVLAKNVIILNSNFDNAIKALHNIAPFKRELEYLFGLYLRFGGYPLVINEYLTRELEKKGFTIDSKVSEVIVRDIIGDLTKIGKQETFVRQILKEILEKYGNRYSFSKLARDIGITHVTTIDYLETLEESFIINLIYAINFNKMDIKFKGNKKVFFQDPFVYYSIKSFLTGLDVNEIIDEIMQDEEITGQIVEGIISSHLIMNQEIPMMKESSTFLWFYYDKKGKEIDNIIRIVDSNLAIEVKYQKDVTPKDILILSQVDNHIILTKEDFKIQEKVLLAPVDMFLALLTKSDRTL